MFGVGSLEYYENFEQVGEGTYGYVFKAYASAKHSASINTALSSSSSPPSSSSSSSSKRGGGSSSGGAAPVPVALKKMIFQHKETVGFPIW